MFAAVVIGSRWFKEKPVLTYLIIVLAVMLPGEAEFKNDQVNVHVNIRANIYTYKVTNLSTSPIVRFEVDEHACYNFMVPEGWEKEISSGLFRAWTTNPQAAIRSNKTAEFSQRVSSTGAVLGRAPAKVQFQSGKTLMVPEVWVPVSEPASYIALVTGLVLSIVLLHTAILLYRDRRGSKATVNDA